MSNVTDSLIEVERDLEVDVQEARRQLELGRQEAIRELNLRRESLGEIYSNIALALDRLAGRAREQLQELQEQLGQLNYLLAEGALDDPRTFDEVRQRLFQQMDATVEELKRIQNHDGPIWENAGGELMMAWNQFRQRLELVLYHVTRDADRANLEFEEQRANLVTRLERLRSEQADNPSEALAKFRQEAEDTYRHFMPWLKALFMMPEQAAPVPDDKTEAKSDDRQKEPSYFYTDSGVEKEKRADKDA